MSILKVWEKPGRRGWREGTHRFYERFFGVQASSPLVGKIEVLADPRLPGDFFPYVLSTGENDVGALVRKRDAQQSDKAGVFWDVRVEYSTRPFPGGTGAPEHQNPNPLLRPPDISFDSREIRVAFVREPFLLDEAGISITEGPDAPKFILNSADDTFDPPPETEECVQVINVSKNVAVFEAAMHRRLQGVVNSKPWFGVDRGFARVRKYKVVNRYENGVGFWREEWAIEIHPTGWFARYLNQGYRALQEVIVGLDDFGEVVEIRLEEVTNSRGSRLSGPSKLDADGFLLPEGEDPIFLEFRKHPEFDFNELELFV